METQQRQTMKEIMNSMDGVELTEKKGGRFHFRLHLTEQMMSVPLETLDLGQRSYNCLKRAGYSTIGDLARSVSEGKELKMIRNCGAKSAREIMEQLFLFQYVSLSPKEREDYLKEVVLINRVNQGTVP